MMPGRHGRRGPHRTAAARCGAAAVRRPAGVRFAAATAACGSAVALLLLLAGLFVLPPGAGAAGATPSGAMPAASGGRVAPVAAATAPEEDVALTVGLFPWVPRPAQVEEAVREAWARRHPDVPLEFVTWDCYASDPPASLDVFVFDAVFRERFRRLRLLHSLPARLLGDAGDFAPAAAEAAYAGGRIWGVPQYQCADMLVYRRGDRALGRAHTLSRLVATLGTGTYKGRRPPRGTGLMIDLSSAWTAGSLYVDATVDARGRYVPVPRLPLRPGAVDPCLVADLRDLRRTASLADARYVGGDGFSRARWFGRGYGRAVVTYTEGLGAMGARGRRAAIVERLPLSDRRDVPLVYVDLVSVSRVLEDGPAEELALAEELAGLVGSSEVAVAALGRWHGRAPQYVLPARLSAFAALGRHDPVYRRIRRVALAGRPHPFLLGAGSRRWFETIAPVVLRRVLAAP